jgi:hypothetical protein
MNEHADGGVGHSERGRAEQSRLDTRHVAGDECNRPSHGGHGERRPPPTPEDKAEQDQYRDHGEPLGRCSHRTLTCIEVGVKRSGDGCGGGFRLWSRFRPGSDGCAFPDSAGWVKSRASRGRFSDAVGALDAAGANPCPRPNPATPDTTPPRDHESRILDLVCGLPAPDASCTPARPVTYTHVCM